MRYLSLFSGIGSPEQALKNLGVDFELVGFSEIDKYAIKSYCAVHGVSEELNLGDITKIDIERLPLDIDLITHGSPCQDFSVAGANKGGDKGTGTRSSLMWNTVAICEYCKPKYVIWENVKNVLSKKHKHNFDKYLDEMDRIGYNNYFEILNAKDYGVPQNRERVFVVSIRKDIDKGFMFPKPFDNGVRLIDMLEENVDESYYISDGKVMQLIEEFKVSKNIKELEDVVKQRSIHACITPDRLNKRQNGRRFKDNGEPMFTITSQDRHGVLIGDFRYDEGLRIRKNHMCPCLTCKVGGASLSANPFVIYKIKQATKKGYDLAFEGDSINLEQPSSTTRRGRVGKQVVNTLNTGSNQAVVQNYKIRKITPLESWRLMGFNDKEFHKAEKVCSNSQLYKQAGNSIVVNVMEEIFKSLFFSKNIEEGINALSLFDGMSCGQLALKKANIKVKNYFASEVKKEAIKVTQENFPNTIQLGDITKLNTNDLPKIDLLIGRSPCQDFSRANINISGLEGKKSGLFYEYLRVLKEVKPKYFLLENVKMKKEHEDVISELLGVKPIEIDSKLVSGALRRRLYWTNIPNIVQPRDKNILLQDVLTEGYTDRSKARGLMEADSRPLASIKDCLFK